MVTAARSGEMRLATWVEMDLEAGVWTIPAARMKAKRDHRVPLSGPALAILHDVQKPSDGTGLVFPNPRGKPRSDATLSQLIKELGIAAVPHGFRSSFRDWAAEATNTPREVVEAALTHTVRNPTEAAYARSDLFERRRLLMNDWASTLGKAQRIYIQYLPCSQSITSPQPVPRSQSDLSGPRTPSMNESGSWIGCRIPDQRHGSQRPSVQAWSPRRAFTSGRFCRNHWSRGRASLCRALGYPGRRGPFVDEYPRYAACTDY